MKINKSKFHAALQIVEPGLAQKELIEQSTSFVFQDGFIMTYNDQISIKHPFEDLAINGAILAKDLYQLLPKLSRDEIILEVKDKELRFTAGKDRAGISIQEEIKLPVEELADACTSVNLPKGFPSALKFAAQACSRDMSRPQLTCVQLHPDGYFVGTDGFRVARIACKIDMDKAILIPADSAFIISRIKPISISWNDAWAHFTAEDGTVVSCRLFSGGKYPKVSNFLKVKGQKFTFPKTTLDIIERASVFAKRDHILDEVLHISIADNRMRIKSDHDHAWYEGEANTPHKGDPITFSISPFLFEQILKETRDCILCQSGNVIKFQKDTWEYIAMLRTV